MASNSRTLQIVLNAKDMTAKAFTKVRGRLQGIRSFAAKSFGVMAQATRGARLQLVMLFAALGGFRALVSGPAEFNRHLQLTGTLGEEARARLGEFRTEVQRIAVQTGIPLEQLNKGLFDTISAGTKAKEAISVLGESARLAVAGGADLRDVVRGLATVTNAYGISGKDAFREVSKELFAAQVIGKTTIGDLTDNVGKIAAVAAEAGIPIREMFTALSDTANIMNNTEEAAVSLRQAIVAILKPNEKLTVIMREAGIPMGSAAFEGRTLGEVFSQIKIKAEELNIPLAAAVGNVRSIGAASVLSQRDGERWSEMLERQAKLADELEISYENMIGTLATTIDRMKNFFKVIAQGFSSGVLIGVNKALTATLENYEILALQAEVTGIKMRQAFELVMPAVHTVMTLFNSFIMGMEIVSAAIVNTILGVAVLIKKVVFDSVTVILEVFLILFDALVSGILGLVTTALGLINDMLKGIKSGINVVITEINSLFGQEMELFDVTSGPLEGAIEGVKSFSSAVSGGLDEFKKTLKGYRDDKTLERYLKAGLEESGARLLAQAERVAESAKKMARSFSGADLDIGKKRIRELEEEIGKLESGLTQARWAAVRKSEEDDVAEARAILKRDQDAARKKEGWKFWENFSIGVDKAREGLKLVASDIQNLGEKTIKEMELATASMFEGWITGAKTAREAFAGFLNSIAKMLSEFMARRVVASFLSLFTGGSVTGASSVDPAAAALADFTPVSPENWGSLPPPEFAHGGVVHRATRALIGEGGPEAIVPLPNGRAIPVQFKGGQGKREQPSPVTINISAVDGASVQRMLLSDDGKRAIQTALRDARSTRRDLRW